MFGVYVLKAQIRISPSSVSLYDASSIISGFPDTTQRRRTRTILSVFGVRCHASAGVHLANSPALYVGRISPTSYSHVSSFLAMRAFEI